MSADKVLIVGGGLSGLCCALELQRQQIPFQILEASDGVGGRVRTDEFEGFRLDRGFQVYLEAYPEGDRILDYQALGLKPFGYGAIVRMSGSFQKVIDPWRNKGDIITALRSPVGTFKDKLTLRQLRNRLMAKSVEEILKSESQTTDLYLRREGFSKRIIERLFRPLVGGIMLDGRLTPSSIMFEFIFKMLSEGDAALPAKGMGEIPLQLAGRLPEDSIRLQSPVAGVTTNSVTLQTGEQIRGCAVVVACDGQEASRLCPQLRVFKWRSARCLYFEAPMSPIEGPWLVLNGNGQWPINHLAVLSEVSPEYAPPGKSLISVSVLGKLTHTSEEVVGATRAQLERWFGRIVQQWRTLRIYNVPFAQPEVTPMLPARLENGTYLAGDYRTIPSINFAMASGRSAGEAVAADILQHAIARPASAC